MIIKPFGRKAIRSLLPQKRWKHFMLSRKNRVKKITKDGICRKIRKKWTHTKRNGRSFKLPYRNGINHIILMRRVKTLRISLCFEKFFCVTVAQQSEPWRAGAKPAGDDIMISRGGSMAA